MSATLLLPGDRPVITIDLAAIRQNWRTVADTYTGAHMGAVIKNDAYGLGSARIAPLLDQLGCRNFWVDTFDAALTVRHVVRDGTIFVLHGMAGVDAAQCRALDIVPVLVSMGDLAMARSDAQRLGPLRVAIHLDSGLSRVGLNHAEVDNVANDLSLLSGLEIAAWVTHLGRFSDPQASENLLQRTRFLEWTARLPRAPLSIATSSCVFAEPSWHLDHARVGSALYGVDTTPSNPQGVVPAATLSAPVLRVATLPPGTEIGYSGAYRTQRTSVIATLAVGYGDGLPFSLANQGQVAIGGRLAPIVGGISMGLIAVDVTSFAEGQVLPGMHATIFGTELRLEQVAASAGIAPNALLVASAIHASRRYVDADKPLHVGAQTS